MRRVLIVLGVLFATSVVIFGAGMAFFYYALTRLDPYPTWMANYLPQGTHSYEQVAGTFSEFVVKTFPIGSDAKNAIGQITESGFRVIKSSSESVELLWRRRAGPVCDELYLIVIKQTADGTITKITGHLQPICL